MTICLRELRALAQEIYGDHRPLSDEELKGVLEDLENSARSVIAENPGRSWGDAVDMATQLKEEDMRMEAELLKKQAYEDILSFHRKIKWAEGLNFNPKTVRAVISNVETIKGPGSQQTLENVVHGRIGQILGGPDGVETLISKQNLWDVHQNPDNEAELAKLRYANEKDSVTDKRLIAYDKIWQDAEDKVLKLMNRYGANVKKLEQRLTRNRHDVNKMMMTDGNYWKHKANLVRLLAQAKGNMDAFWTSVREMAFERWYKTEINILDHTKTFKDIQNTEEAKRTWMRHVYDNLITRSHRKIDILSQSDDTPEDMLVPKYSYKVGASFAKRLEQQHRLLFYKNSAAELEHIKNYAPINSIKVGRFQDMLAAAKHIAFLQEWGPHAEQNWEAFRDQIFERNKFHPKMRSLLQRSDWEWQRLSGRSNTPVNYKAARFWGNIRSVLSMSRLGLVVPNSFSDLAVQAAELKFNGVGFFDRWNQAFSNYANIFKTSKEQKEFYAMLGEVSQAMMGEMNRFSMPEDIGGSISKANKYFFKFTGLIRHDHIIRGGMRQGVARQLGRFHDQSFSNLLPETRNNLELHGFGEKEWDLIRKYPQALEGKRYYIAADSVREASPKDIAKYLGKPLSEVSSELVERTKDELENRMMAFFHDEANHAIIQPTVGDQEMWLRGTQPGTVKGEIARFIGMYKMFSTGFVRRVLMRQMFLGHSASASTLAVIQMAVSVAALNYISKTATDFLHNRTPVDPSKLNAKDKFEWAQQIMAPSLGILGDLLAFHANNYAGTITDRFGGPMLGNVEDMGKLFSLLKDEMAESMGSAQSAPGKETPTGKQLRNVTGHLITNNLPFINLWGASNAIKFLYLKAFGDSIDEVAWNKARRNMIKNHGQEPLFNPFQ